MATIAPDPTESTDTGWLGSFLQTWVPGSGAPIEDREPATGRHIITVAGSTPDDVARAAEAAKAAQPAWAATSYQERARILRRAADIYEAHRDEFGTWTQRETGRRVPVGVIGAITPWNSPSVLGMRVVAPALALGNAVVLKPDPQTPVIGGAMFEAVFREAGLPEGLLQVVVGGADVGEALVTDPNIPVVSFTGSTAVGRRVGQLAGGMLKKVSLELGGNNAFIVLDDADLDAAAAAGAFSAFQFQGQVCFAAGRHLVHRGIADAYIAALTQKAGRLRTGDPYREDVQLGPIVNEKQVGRVDDIVQRSIAAGAVVNVGATYEGLFYQPTVLTDVTPDMAAFTDEIFGPVAPITVFDTDEEAVALANASAYGLVASIYTRSLGRGLTIADQMRTGMVHINDGTLNDEAIIPFGGMGESGNGGRYGGEASLDTFTEWQWVTVRDEPPTFPF
jgi:benzaldehyde dehydrogenase (NAD)